MLDDNARRLLDELERVICVRETVRRHWKDNPHKTTTEEENRMRQLCEINDTIDQAKTAIIEDDPRRMIMALGQTKRHP